VIDGDAALFELILRRYKPRLFRIGRSIIGEDAEAEDVVQEGMFEHFKTCGNLRGEPNSPTWLRCITWSNSLKTYVATIKRH
jgi:RNA polymerase sigma-70 factor, ECF subfamily